MVKSKHLIYRFDHSIFSSASETRFTKPQLCLQLVPAAIRFRHRRFLFAQTVLGLIKITDISPHAPLLIY